MIDINNYLSIQKKLGSSNIELTNKCPLQCLQCERSLLKSSDLDDKNYIKQKIKESFDIDLNSFRKLCHFFDNTIALCGQFSDPIYHENFFEILKICSTEFPDKKFKIHTAAHQKNLDWYEQAFNLTGKNVKWIFGLDGLPNTSFLYRKNQNSQLIFDAILLGKKMKINVVWQFIAFKYNEHQINSAKKICEEKNIEFKLILTNRTTGKIELASDNLRSHGPIKEYKSLKDLI
jgi:MoaA/NifB/PqqE/SkfB family radical SAM enzyme